MPRHQEGESIAIGSVPGIPPRADDYSSLRRDYAWRDPARLKARRLTRSQAEAHRRKLDAQARATPVPFRWNGKNAGWEELPASTHTPTSPPSPSPAPTPAPPSPPASKSALKRIAALSEPPLPSSSLPATPTSSPSPPSMPSPTPVRHKRYLRRCPCEACESRRAAG